MKTKRMKIVIFSAVVFLGFLPCYNIIHDIFVIQDVKSTLAYLKDFNKAHNRYPTKSEFEKYATQKTRKLADPKYLYFVKNYTHQSVTLRYILNSSFVREKAPGEVGRDTGFYIGNSINICNDEIGVCDPTSNQNDFIEDRPLLQEISYGNSSSSVFEATGSTNFFLSKGMTLSFNNTFGCSNCTSAKFVDVIYDHSFFVTPDMNPPDGIFLILKAIQPGNTTIQTKICALSQSSQCITHVYQTITVNITDQFDENTPRM